jgi:nitrite reductase/ring-hydroxylating ferredoxin subunit
MSVAVEELKRVATLDELRQRGVIVLSDNKPGIAVFYTDGRVYAVDNRCPHMGFPLSRGTVCDGILTCHWHHARFDLESGGTLDPFADDVRTYPTIIEDGVVYVDPRSRVVDRRTHWKRRLTESLEQNIELVTIKSVLALLEDHDPESVREIVSIGARFGATYREAGWGPGLTILTAMANILPTLSAEDRALALYHGLTHVARDCANQPVRFMLKALPTPNVPYGRLKAWFRNFTEVRDTDAAERTLRTAIAAGAPPVVVADMFHAAATDHYFLGGGHTLDFINKAFELLDHIGWDEAETVLTSLVRGLALAQRSEELNSWRHPVDLVALLNPVFERLPALSINFSTPRPWDGFDRLVELLVDDDPGNTVDALVSALDTGVYPLDLAQALCYASALRIARFPTSNEFGDWITVLHTFSYCNALHRALERAPSVELLRGLFHGAMRIYLDRFLNVPAVRLPDKNRVASLPPEADALLQGLIELLDREQQVNAAGAIVYRYLSLGHPVEGLLACLGHLLLREDGEFHSYQMLEAGVRQYRILLLKRPNIAINVLVAIARYLAAHAPTSRSMLQTARIAIRLSRGEELYTEDTE